MSSLKLKHSGGNSMSIEAPATNPASNLALKLPSTIGSANQILKNSGTAGTLGWSTFVEDSNGNVGIGTTSINYPSGGGLTIYNATTPRLKLCNSDSGTGSGDGGEISFHDNTKDLYIENREGEDIVFYAGAERMRINPSGIVTKPNQPSFNAYSTGSWTHGSDTGTLNIDTITSEAFDVGGNYNHSTGVFTAPVAGKYFFTFTYSYICTSGYLNVYLKKGVSGNYSTYARMQSSPPQQSSNYSDASGISGIIDLAAQNTVRPQAELNYAGNQIWNINFSGYLIG